MREGDVVIVTAKLDSRIQDANPEDAIGTLVQLTQREAWVLLRNHDIWVGSSNMIFRHKDEPAPSNG